MNLTIQISTTHFRTGTRFPYFSGLLIVLQGHSRFCQKLGTLLLSYSSFTRLSLCSASWLMLRQCVSEYMLAFLEIDSRLMPKS